MSFTACPGTWVNGGPNPSRTWSRAPPNCSGDITPERAAELQMRRKAEVLKHSHNSSSMTKKQLWARIASGASVGGRRQTWAVQTATVSEPNAKGLYRIPGTNILSCKGNPSEVEYKPICKPATNSDVPMTKNADTNVLCYDKRVPVTRMIIRRQYTQA